MTYTKITGTIANAQDLLSVLSTNLISYGWTQSFLGDNIISSVNLGKKLIMKKGNIYTYFAASDNNEPTQNNASFSSISCLKFCCSNVLNTTNNWFINDAKSGSRLTMSGIQISSGAAYKLYINNDNFILTVMFATGLYSTMIIGNTKRSGFYGSGSVFGTNLSSGRMTNYPLFSDVIDNKVIFKNDVVVTNTVKFSVLNVSSTGGADNRYPNYSLTFSSNDGLINRATSSLNDISIIFNIKTYSTTDGIRYKPVFDIDDIGLVNFANMSSTQADNESVSSGLKTFDFIPFLRKESPQTYSNAETYGCGLSIRLT